MKKTRRLWSIEQKLQILQEAAQNGPRETFRKYNLSPSLFNRWKNSFDSKGIARIHAKSTQVDPALKALLQENERLKRIIANQALELDFKTELLKKAIKSAGA